MVDAQVACAIAILLHAPIRAQNTVSIEVGHQLTLPSMAGAEGALRFEAGTVKNTRVLTFKLPADVAALLTRYMIEIQPYFHRTSRSPALFPGSKNPHKSVTNLGAQILTRVEKATGVKLNQNLFRHLCAFLYLRNNPESYAAVQELLGHKDIKTTKAYYCGLEGEALLSRISQAMADLKATVGLDPTDMSHVLAPRKARRRSAIARTPRASSKIGVSAPSTGIAVAGLAMPRAEGVGKASSL
jgi:integrase